jgi:hypothetical protein
MKSRFWGYGFKLMKGKPVWLWTMVDLEPLSAKTGRTP